MNRFALLSSQCFCLLVWTLPGFTLWNLSPWSVWEVMSLLSCFWLSIAVAFVRLFVLFLAGILEDSRIAQDKKFILQKTCVCTWHVLILLDEKLTIIGLSHTGVSLPAQQYQQTVSRQGARCSHFSFSLVSSSRTWCQWDSGVLERSSSLPLSNCPKQTQSLV